MLEKKISLHHQDLNYTAKALCRPTTLYIFQARKSGPAILETNTGHSISIQAQQLAFLLEGWVYVFLTILLLLMLHSSYNTIINDNAKSQ